MHRRRALVHQPWTNDWWGGGATDPERDRAARLAAIFGPPPSLPALLDAATARTIDPPAAWTQLLHGRTAHAVPRDALVVLAGQQPILLGGAALVAHKASTAIALARHLEATWGRRVIPVFLIATEDHDTSEVDHVDFWDPMSTVLRRVRSPLAPPHDRFMSCTLDETSYKAAYEIFKAAMPQATRTDVPPQSAGESVASTQGGDFLELTNALRFTPAFVAHFESMLDAVFGPLGLLTVRAHELTARAGHVLGAGLTRRAELAESLEAGARALRRVGLPASFDAADPRPLALESRSGRRRRIAADDTAAASRFVKDPTSFSPHAALRPVIQATALPVVAQVCGPSELLYLGQARGLHALLRATPPVLVPRLEATSVSPELLRAMHADLSTLPLPGVMPDGQQPPGPPVVGGVGTADPAADELARHETALLDSARAFSAAAKAIEPANAAAAERWLSRVEHGARRLAETPLWRGHIRQDARSVLRPRGRPQDTVLAWLPDALHHGAPRLWAEHIVSLCRPLDQPAHVLHVPPGEVTDG